ncbi:MAG: PorV/PorQ family protein [Bacteroidetes bacterium]|nr:PorV/PorQ family protein [Bacteroidota bacterium]
MSLKNQLLLIFFYLSILSVRGQFRKYSNEFLNIGAGARGLSMGGAQVATVADGTAGYWNPAGLIQIGNEAQFNLMHASYFAGIGKYDYLSYAKRSEDKKHALGFTALRFAVDDIMNTLFLVEPDGSLNYNNIQAFSSADYAFLLTYARELKTKSDEGYWRFGVNTKVIHRSVGKFAKAWGFGADVGIQYESEKWEWGITARDVTTTFNAWSFRFTEQEKEVLNLTNNEIPVRSSELTAPRLVLGAARRFNFGKSSSLLAELNTDLTFDGKRNTLFRSDLFSIDPRLGLELSVKNQFFLRVGVNNFQQALADGDTLNQKRVWIFQPGAGVGFKTQQVAIDYAFINLANQSNPLFTHVFSFRLDIKTGKRKRPFDQ